MDEKSENLQSQPKNNQLASKLVVLAVLISVTWIATMFVWGVVQDRENRQEEASGLISEQWRRPQTIAGPVLTIPVEKTNVTAEGERVVKLATLTLLPKDLVYDSQVGTELLKRGVYEIPVYTTTVSGSGNFNLSDIEKRSLAGARILWDQAVVSVNVTDPRGISSMFNLAFNGKQYEMQPSSKFRALDSSGVHTNVAIDSNQTDHQFSFALPLKGSREISYLPLGENTDVTVDSSWKAPNFTGAFLPENREVTKDGFKADWKITPYGKNLPQSWLGTVAVDRETLRSKAFGVGLYQAVDFYTMVNRATKYSILLSV